MKQNDEEEDHSSKRGKLMFEKRSKSATPSTCASLTHFRIELQCLHSKSLCGCSRFSSPNVSSTPFSPPMKPKNLEEERKGAPGRVRVCIEIVCSLFRCVPCTQVSLSNSHHVRRDSVLLLLQCPRLLDIFPTTALHEN